MSTVVIVSFGLLVFVALAVAFSTRDWRLKTVATACFGIWCATNILAAPGLPSPGWLDPFYSIALIGLLVSIQARGAVERARGEPLAMWLLVPMGAEAVIAISYLTTPWLLSSLLQLQLIQLGFAVELVCVIVVGGRRLRLARRFWDALDGAGGPSVQDSPSGA